MQATRPGLWRVPFFLCAVLLAAGGPQHPGGTMAEMLASPRWVPSHLLLLAALIAFLAGLALLARQELPERTRRWTRIAIAGVALEAVEMAFHTAAAVDHANLVAGRPTPVLTAHLRMAVAIYPLFGVAVIGFIVAATRERVVGSRWIAWLGIAGIAAYSAAPPLVVAFHVPGAGVLFPLLMLFALWLILAAVWPGRQTEWTPELLAVLGSVTEKIERPEPEDISTLKDPFK